MLAHELTLERDFDTYLSRRLSPLRPLLSYGRSARAFPQTQVDEVVYNWWKDCLFRKCFKKQWATFLLHPGIESVRQLSPPPLPETIDPTAIVVVFAHKNSLNDFICHFCMPMNANNDFVIATRCCRSLHAERVLGRRLDKSWFKTLGKCSFWETPLLPMVAMQQKL